jgi:hypothetical protein
MSTTNTFITPSTVAKMALARLRNNLVYPNLVHKDFSADFANQVGDTVTVRVPASFTAADFSTDISAQNITESSVSVVLNKFKDVSVIVTSKQFALSLVDFESQIVGPAIDALAQAVDLDIALTLFEGAGNTVSSTSATVSTLANIGDCAKALDNAQAPTSERYLVMTPYHKYRYGLVDNLAKAAYAGDTAMLRDNDLGRVFGMQTFMDQNTPKSTATTSGTAVGTMKVASSSDAGEIDITELSGATATLAVGDGFVYGGVLYRLTETATGSGSAVASRTVSPAFPASVAATTVVIVRNGTSLAFHKNAAAFVTRPLDIPMGAAKAYVASADGLSIRVVFDYNSTKKYDTISFDLLYGTKILRSTHAVRLVDGTLA